MYRLNMPTTAMPIYCLFNRYPFQIEKTVSINLCESYGASEYARATLVVALFSNLMYYLRYNFSFSA